MKKYIVMIILLLGTLSTLIVINNKIKNNIDNNKEISNLNYKDSEALKDKKKELENSIEAQKIKISELESEIKSLNDTLESDKNKLEELDN